ncbi:Unannotated [Lentimonas sp. CC19]|nr:Unannotated [Lentimonas sp. CC19]CAA6695848.1 Unannotated [Lentimonas sp. CC10]CAA7069768.1 Unannotated [Lentimonas sp. CC11]
MGTDAHKLLLIYNKAYGSLTAYPWMFAHNAHFVVDVLAPRGHIIQSSRWVRRVFDFNEEEDLFASLVDLLASGEYAAIHCIDESSRNLILEHNEDVRLRSYLPFPFDSPLNTVCCDKVSFHQWCQTEGVPVPKSVIAQTIEGLKRSAADMGYPFILKGAFGSRGTTVWLIESELQLVSASESFPEMPAWLVQEYLPGKAGTSSIVCREGVLYTACHSYKTVTLDGGFGTSAVKTFVSSEELDQLAHLVAERTRVNGATGYDWILDSAGRPLLIDPHFGRGPSSMMISHLDGVMIDAALAASLSGADPIESHCSKIKHVWIFPQCLSLIFEGRVREAWQAANLFKKDVAVFLCGHGEWRLFFKQVVPLAFGKFRVLLGGLRRRCFGD